MERIATDLALRLAEALESLARGPERILHVHCDEHTAELAEKVVTAVASRAPSIAIALRSPVTGAEHEWGARAVELACWHAAVHRDQATRGEPPRMLPRGLLARPDASSFAAVLGAVLACIPRDAPVYVVFAPVVATRALDVTTLATLAGALPAHARVICLEREAASCELQATRGVRTLDLRLDETQFRHAIAARFDAMAAAPEDATGIRATGAAGPRVAPSPRPSRALAPSVELQEARGSAARARRALASFAAALLRNDVHAILATQQVASDALSSVGARPLANQLRVARAAALAATGRLEDALRECADLRHSAHAADDRGASLAALSCTAGLLIAAGQLARARSTCDELATVAENAGAPLFAAHALRSCAQLASRCGDPAGAAAALDRAIAIGERAEPYVVLAGPFTTIIAELVALCRAHGLHVRARDGERRARALAERAHEALSAAREEDA